MKNYGILALTCLSLLSAPSTVRAGDTISFRLLGNIGAWADSFNQSDSNNHSAHVASLIGPGLNFQLGARFGILFAEYDLTWLISSRFFHWATDASGNTTAADNVRNMGYLSALGLNAGLSLPMLPVEGYVGIERGSLWFSDGLKTSYGGYAAKIGARVFLVDRFGIMAQYRRHFLKSDDVGPLPDNVSTSAHSFFVGLVFGQR